MTTETTESRIKIPPELRGERVTLRPLRLFDMFRIIRWLFDNQIRRFFKPILSADNQNWALTLWTRRDTIIFSIWIQGVGSKKVHIGNIGFQEVDFGNNEAEYGFGIGSEENRNKGYGTEALELLLDFAFNQLGLSSVYARVLVNNTRAIHVHEGVGFKQEGELEKIRTPDGLKDVVQFRITK